MLRIVGTVSILLAVGATAATGCTEAAQAGEQAGFTIVSLPDTQYYSAAHPEIFEAQIRWILEQRDQAKIALVVHEGDIVDADDRQQWERAAHSLHALDGRVPYVLGTGNHDYRRAGRFISRDSLIDDYFPPSAFSSTAWFKGTFEPEHIENSYSIVGPPGGSWLILSLEFGPRDAVLEWADRIAKRYPTLPAIVVTHAYLDSFDNRYDHSSRADQPWNSSLYLDAAVSGATNDGEEIWRKLIATNANIRFVLCGHDLGDGVGRLTSVRQDGTTVHQLLANYQTEPRGGQGFLRVMRFLPAEGRVKVETYSPFLNQYKRAPENDFQLVYGPVPSPTLAVRRRDLDKGPELTPRL